VSELRRVRAMLKRLKREADLPTARPYQKVLGHLLAVVIGVVPTPWVVPAMRVTLWCLEKFSHDTAIIFSKELSTHYCYQSAVRRVVEAQRREAL